MNRAIPQNRPALSAGTDHRPAALASPEACPPAGTDSRIPIGTLTHELRASNEQLENAHGGLIGIDESSLDGASSGSSFRLRKPRFLSPSYASAKNHKKITGTSSLPLPRRYRVHVRKLFCCGNDRM